MKVVSKTGFFNQPFFRRRIWVRSLVQAFFFGLIALISINHSLAESGQGIPLLASASLHALCPFGGVVTIYQYATAGTFVQKIHESSFILMIIAFLMALLFGPVFCGWVCPLGSVQEWFAGIGRKLFKKRRYNHFIPA
ncbi:MAG: 4Fe-4S binding protein, partial [Anaerolineae bacterium]|nr:4Fe-4S binding protein [Anaerolineae bacterium]